MDKRLFLALALSFLIILGWNRLLSILYPVDIKEVTENKSQSSIDLNKALPSLPEEKIKQDIVQEINLETINLDGKAITFSLPTAAIKDIQFKDYQNYSFSLQNGFWLKDKNLQFTPLKLGSESIFVHEDQEKKIIKHFIFHNTNNNIELEIIIENISDHNVDISYPLVFAEFDLAKSNIESRFQEAMIAYDSNTSRLNLKRNFTSSDNTIKYLAVKDRYFCAITQPNFDDFIVFVNKINSKTTEAGMTISKIIMPGQKEKFSFIGYIGPQKLDVLQALNPDWTRIINFGTFDFISRMLLKLLQFFHSLVHNWGIAIIMLSLSIYFMLFPLSLKQMRSMKRMQELQPKMERIRQIYKDNPQKLNKEVMELYKNEKVNPFSGCLPLLLQLPIFFALYQSLMRTVELKGANFLWIKDLSEPDRLYTLSNTLPVIGKEINILPILMMLAMFFQQRLSSVPTGSTSQEQQRMMTILFPLLFGFIFYHMPSGLVLYWFINTSLMSVYQFSMKSKH